MRQIIPFASSPTRRAPSFATATPTGRPMTPSPPSGAAPFTRKSVANGSIAVAVPVASNRMRTTSYPLGVPRFQDPWKAANASPR